MQVLHFCPLPLFSGLEQYALRLALEESARGVDVGFVALAGSQLETECKKTGLRTFTVDFKWKSSLWRAAAQYKDVLSAHPELGVIHLHSSQDIDRLGLALLRCRLAGQPRTPKIIQQNHVWISHSKRDPAHWLTHKILDEIWCSSTPAKRDIERFLPVDPARVHVIPYGRDLKVVESFDSRESARRELSLPAEAVVIGAIARIDRGKGVWELLQASVELMQEGRDFHLVIVGGPTLSDPVSIRFAEEVEDFCERLMPQFRSHVHLAGPIPNAARLLRAFDLYAQVAYKETFSLALLDAQLAELPVIGTDSGGTPEVVRENETGWLAKPEDIASLKGVILRALQERSRWNSFGRIARARVERDFDLNVVVPMILDRYGLDHRPEAEVDSAAFSR